METSVKQSNIIVSWFRWHFYETSKFLLLVWKNYILFCSDFFSIFLLLKTFFYPWRRYKWRYPKGFRVGEFFETLISNTFSRIFGAIFRSFLIISGILAQIFIFMAGITIILFWILIPFIIIFGFWLLVIVL